MYLNSTSDIQADRATIVHDTEQSISAAACLVVFQGNLMMQDSHTVKQIEQESSFTHRLRLVCLFCFKDLTFGDSIQLSSIC